MAKPKSQNPDVQWVPPPDTGLPSAEEPPVDMERVDLSELPPVSTEPEADLIFGPELSDVRDGVPPESGEVGFAPDLPPPPKVTPIDISGAPWLAPSKEPEGEPETIVIGRESDAAPPPTEPYTNGNGQSQAQPIQVTAEMLERMLGIAEAAVAQKGQPQVVQVSTAMTPEQGAQTLLTLIDERYAQQLQQIAVDKASGSIAVVIAGILTRVADTENLADFAFNEDWLHSVNQTPNAPIQQTVNGQPQLFSQHQNICEYCKHPFKPIVASNRQRFCCNACGNIATGRTDEPLPHRMDCSTQPGIELGKIMKASKLQEAA